MDWSRIISAGVGPIIVISACGLLCLAFYNRLAAIVARLRAFSMQSINEEEALACERRRAQPDDIALVRHQELLGMLRVQTEQIRSRARLIRSTLQCLLSSIACLAICSGCVGLSTAWPSLIYSAVAFFIAGLTLLVVAVLFAMIEMHHALDPVELEGRFVADLLGEFAEHTVVGSKQNPAPLEASNR